MAEFNPFDIPEQGSQPQTPKVAPRQPATPGKPAPKPTQKFDNLLNKLPNNAFGKFLRRFWIPVVAVVAVVLVLAVFGNAIMTTIAPEWAVARGSKKTTDAIAKRLDKTPYKAVEILADSMVKGTVGGEFTYYDDWTDVSGAVELTSDLKELSFMVGADVSVDGTDVDGQMYFNKERVALSSSYLPDCYGVTFASFEDDLRASALPEMMDLSEENIQMAGDVMEQAVEMMDFDVNGLLDDYNKLAEDFMKDLDFETDSDKVEVGGEDVKCTLVTTQVDEKDLKNLTVDSIELLLENEDVRASVIAAMMVDGYYTQQEAEREYDQMTKDATRQVEEALQQMQIDMEYTYYLYKNQLVMVGIAGEMVVDGERAEMEGKIDFGRNPAKDDWIMEMVVTTPYGDEMTISGEYTSEIDGDDYEDSLTIGVDDGYSFESVELSTEWDKKSGDLDIYMNDGYSGYSFACNLIVDGDKCTLTLDDFSQMLGEEAYLEVILTADSGGKIEDPDFVNLDQWDEDTINEVRESVMNAAYGASDTSASFGDMEVAADAPAAEW